MFDEVQCEDVCNPESEFDWSEIEAPIENGDDSTESVEGLGWTMPGIVEN